MPELAGADILAGNFLPNADLEADLDFDGLPDGWFRGGTQIASARWESSHVLSGKHNLALADSSSSTWSSWTTEVGLPRVMEELELQWSWGYSITSRNANDAFRVSVDWLANGDSVGNNVFQVSGSRPAHELVNRILVVPDGADAVRLEFATGGPAATTGLIYFDDVSVSIPGAGAYGDLNADGRLNARDLDEWAHQVTRGVDNIQLDLNRDSVVDAVDREFWVEWIKLTYFGDANMDFVFDSTDLILAFQSGEYEDAIPLNSTWSTGDWNGDLEFDSADVIVAFQGGGFDKGYRTSVTAVPEPAGTWPLILAGAASLTRFRQPSQWRCRVPILRRLV